MSVIISSFENSIKDFLSTKNYSKIIVLVDANTKKHCYPVIKNHLPKHELIVVRSGESHKNLETCQEIWSKMTDAQLDRHALMLNLGGGVIGDMGGFCAATYKRGIDFVQVPTTLLSQVDASVGGKLGVDFQGFKNHIGVFTQPNSVLIDPVFLQTLPKSELRSGFAEIVKHCLIQDAEKWREIKQKDLEEQNFEDLIRHSVEIKKKVVAQDPTEKGLRKILNFGHTLGHAIETYFLGTKNHLLHGEAIAVGMICEAFLGFKKGMITDKELQEIEEFIFSIYGKVKMQSSDFEAIIGYTLQDKKNLGKQVRFSILDKIGSCAFDIVINKAEMKKALEYYVA